jgi:outer membrane immunogenic protein
MRHLRLRLLTGAALSVVCAPGAFSASPAPVWTGFYAGGNIGYSWGQSDVTVNNLSFGGFGAGGGSLNLSPSGFIAGLQAGYNYQFSRNWVAGLETDFQWSAQKDSGTTSTNFDVLVGGGEATGTTSTTVESKLSWLGTVRGRIGYVADAKPDVLWYGTGGLAYGRVATSASSSMTGTYINNNTSNCEGPAGCLISGALSFSDAQIQLGWTLGAGVEILADKWTWKLEYLYVDLGTASGTVPLSGTVCTPVCTSFAGTTTYSNRITDNIVRVGLNYRFWP